MTNRRVNALENVTIPKIEGVLAYIGRELDELEREGMCTQGMEEDALFEPRQSRFVSFFKGGSIFTSKLFTVGFLFSL